MRYLIADMFHQIQIFTWLKSTIHSEIMKCCAEKAPSKDLQERLKLTIKFHRFSCHRVMTITCVCTYYSFGMMKSPEN